MLEFETNLTSLTAELNEEIRSFFPHYESVNHIIKHEYSVIDEVGKNNKIIKHELNSVVINGEKFEYKTPLYVGKNMLEKNRLHVRACKKSLYDALKTYFKRSLPWGSLTGIRPTRALSQLIGDRGKIENSHLELMRVFDVSKEKAQLAERILNNQKSVVPQLYSLVSGKKSNVTSILANLYVHIPFCVSRCEYCSFVTTTIDKQKWIIEPYINALINEINYSKQILSENKQKVFSVYVGGGTPTSINDELLDRVLSSIAVCGVEFTCEAGRPDTITDANLSVMSANGVNRISVNPQTLRDETLQRIGRKHTTKQFFNAYKLAEKYGFRKNVDLIAGLNGEKFSDFKYSLDGVIELFPENVTVHTLSLKRGSDLSGKVVENSDTEQMVNYSIEKLLSCGYEPYYLYRQKQMLGNHENIGWTRNHELICVNNVSVMEEQLSVMACGAGAISKRIYPTSRIERYANIKDVITYLDKFEERLNKKKIFWLN